MCFTGIRETVHANSSRGGSIFDRLLQCRRIASARAREREKPVRTERIIRVRYYPRNYVPSFSSFVYTSFSALSFLAVRFNYRRMPIPLERARILRPCPGNREASRFPPSLLNRHAVTRTTIFSSRFLPINDDDDEKARFLHSFRRI